MCGDIITEESEPKAGLKSGDRAQVFIGIFLISYILLSFFVFLLQRFSSLLISLSGIKVYILTKL